MNVRYRDLALRGQPLSLAGCSSSAALVTQDESRLGSRPGPALARSQLLPLGLGRMPSFPWPQCPQL